MAIIDVPEVLGFSKVNSFKLQRFTNILRSKFTGQGQRISYPFAVWMLEAQLRDYDGIAAGQIRSFLLKLEGQKNSFRLPLKKLGMSVSPFMASYLALNANAAARAVSIQTKTNNVGVGTVLFNEGDMFTLQDEAKTVTAPVVVGASGITTVSFMPGLRKTASNNVEIEIRNPTVLLTASDDDIADFGVSPPFRQSSKFEAVEAV